MQYFFICPNPPNRIWKRTALQYKAENMNKKGKRN